MAWSAHDTEKHRINTPAVVTDDRRSGWHTCLHRGNPAFVLALRCAAGLCRPHDSRFPLPSAPV